MILEWLSLSSYYYWGSYDIADQNSSTNVTKSVHHTADMRSPAKVFTASNTPHFVNHLGRLPSPTETFVRNYGPRLHQIALAVADGERSGSENIEFVVRQIEAQGRRFLLDVIGSKEQGRKQIFSIASEHSSLIIEYVQRFGGFDGFFAKDNVARPPGSRTNCYGCRRRKPQPHRERVLNGGSIRNQPEAPWVLLSAPEIRARRIPVIVASGRLALRQRPPIRHPAIHTVSSAAPVAVRTQALRRRQTPDHRWNTSFRRSWLATLPRAGPQPLLRP